MLHNYSTLLNFFVGWLCGILQKNSIFDVVIGEPIPISSIDSTRTLDQWCQEIREKCYKLKEK